MSSYYTNPDAYFLEKAIYNCFLILKHNLEDLPKDTKPTDLIKEDIERIQEILNEILAR